MAMDVGEFHFHIEDGIAWNGSAKPVYFTMTRWQADKGTSVSNILVAPETAVDFGGLLAQLAPGPYILTFASMRQRKIKASIIVRLHKSRAGTVRLSTVGS